MLSTWRSLAVLPSVEIVSRSKFSASCAAGAQQATVWYAHALPQLHALPHRPPSPPSHRTLSPPSLSCACRPISPPVEAQARQLSRRGPLSASVPTRPKATLCWRPLTAAGLPYVATTGAIQPPLAEPYVMADVPASQLKSRRRHSDGGPDSPAGLPAAQLPVDVSASQPSPQAPFRWRSR